MVPHTPFPDPIRFPAFQTPTLSWSPTACGYLPACFPGKTDTEEKVSELLASTCPCPCVSASILDLPLELEEPSSSVYPGQLTAEAGSPFLCLLEDRTRPLCAGASCSTSMLQESVRSYSAYALLPSLCCYGFIRFYSHRVVISRCVNAAGPEVWAISSRSGGHYVVSNFLVIIKMLQRTPF